MGDRLPRQGHGGDSGHVQPRAQGGQREEGEGQHEPAGAGGPPARSGVGGDDEQQRQPEIGPAAASRPPGAPPKVADNSAKRRLPSHWSELGKA